MVMRKFKNGVKSYALGNSEDKSKPVAETEDIPKTSRTTGSFHMCLYIQPPKMSNHFQPSLLFRGLGHPSVVYLRLPYPARGWPAAKRLYSVSHLESLAWKTSRILQNISKSNLEKLYPSVRGCQAQREVERRRNRIAPLPPPLLSTLEKL